MIYNHQMLTDLRSDASVHLQSYRLLTEHVALVTYTRAKDLIRSYGFGNFIIPSAVTAKGRIMIVELNRTAERHG